MLARPFLVALTDAIAAPLLPQGLAADAQDRGRPGLAPAHLVEHVADVGLFHVLDRRPAVSSRPQHGGLLEEVAAVALRSRSRARNSSARGRISSRRFLRGASFSRTTFSRWNRSSRNRPAWTASARSWVEEATKRTSTSRVRVPPSRSKRRSSTTRSSLACRARLRSWTWSK